MHTQNSLSNILHVASPYENLKHPAPWQAHTQMKRRTR